VVSNLMSDGEKIEVRLKDSTTYSPSRLSRFCVSVYNAVVGGVRILLRMAAN